MSELLSVQHPALNDVWDHRRQELQNGALKHGHMITATADWVSHHINQIGEQFHLTMPHKTGRRTKSEGREEVDLTVER